MKLTWVTNNLWSKVGAVCLAVGLWFFVAGEETVEEHLKIPIKLILAEEMVVTEQEIRSLDVFVKSRKEILDQLSTSDLVCKIDLSSYTEPQTMIFSVDKGDIPLSNKEVNIVKITPDRVRVKIDRLVKRVMPIHVVTEGEAAPGYEVAGFIIDPVSTMVRAPEGYLKDREYIDTEPVDITGRQKSFRKMTTLRPLAVSGESKSVQSVEVVVRIEEKAKGKKK